MADLLRGYPGPMDLPIDRPAPPVRSGRSGRVRFDLDADLDTALAGLAEAGRVSRSTVALAAVYLLLTKYAGRRDICLGAPIAVRVNATARTVPDLLDEVRAAYLAGVEHAESPPPPLQVMLAYQEPVATAEVDLGFSFRDGGAAAGITYCADLFDRPTIERMAGHLERVLRWLASHPDGELATLTLLSPAEDRLVRVEWNRTELDFPRDCCLHELVDEQAARRPNQVAVIGPDETLTYAELTARSDRLAARLVGAGVALEDRVAVCVPRSARLVVAMLGLLKAGGAYVPLDPTYPVDRLRRLEDDARATVLIATGDTRRAGIGAGIATVVDIDEPLPVGRVEPPRKPGPENIAYMLYTSGSTGRPKGVVVEHRAVVNMLYGHMAWYSFDESDVWSQFGACGFDMAIYEHFMPLLTGATSVIATEDERMDARRYVDFVNRNRITVQVCTPTFLRSLDQPELPTVRTLITGGEVANMSNVAHYAGRKTFVNCYGPTEVTICTTSYRATGAETGLRLPIGRPHPNTTVYIVDSEGQLCPVGVPGEIHIGGIGLARGYWHDPELTADRFVTVPALGSERLYRTGDRARWLPDGNVDFLGRNDDYVKLRGYRVGPGEIEAVLTTHPAVTQAAVLVLDESLVAFVVGSAGTQELRPYLTQRLPYYMVPGRFVPVTRIPMTEHIKVDRRALAALLTDTAPDTAHAAPTTRTEARLAPLWAELLEVSGVAPDSDFFVLGGHSLLIGRLLDRVEAEFGIRIGIRDFLTTPTLRGLAGRIEGTAAAGDQVSATDAEVRPVPRFSPPTIPASDLGGVLLTGATGFVGAFLLRELLGQTTDTVTCLVRASSAAAAADRVRQAVRHYRLGIDPDDERIVAVPADLGGRGLGLDAGTHDQIAGTVDTIVHAGAWVNHLSSYQRLRPANVDGTAELVRLAALSRPKRLHLVSSMSVFAEAPGRVISEETPTVGQRHSPGHGYAASKWIADLMVDRAIGRGLTGGIYRLGRMAGDSVRGVTSLDDMFSRLVRSCAAVRAHPTEAALDANLLPVDVAARALVALARDTGQPGAHHLHHPTTVPVGRFMAVHDPDSEPVPLAEWLDRIRRGPRELPIQPYEPALLELARSGGAAAPTTYCNETTLTRLASIGVPIPEMTDELIERYWHFLLDASPYG